MNLCPRRRPKGPKPGPVGGALAGGPAVLYDKVLAGGQQGCCSTCLRSQGMAAIVKIAPLSIGIVGISE